jgi:hypothetical protein
MHLHSDDASELAEALERQLELHAEAAKRAIREYKKTILREPGSARDRKIEGQREVERAVSRYMQLRKRLDEVRAEMSTSSANW